MKNSICLKSIVFLTNVVFLTSVVFLSAAQEPPMVPVATVMQGEDFQTLQYPGKVIAVARVDLVARVGGEIMSVGFKNGEIVKKGQVLYTLDSIKYEAAVKNAEAKIAEYKARVAYAKNDFERNKKLSDTQTVSKDSMESALATRDAALAVLAAAEADLFSAQDDLNHCKIVAPIQGKIGTNRFTEGNYVTPTSGILVTLVQTSPIRVRFSISNRDYLNMFDGHSSTICKNGTVELTLANDDKYDEEGLIEYVENISDENTDTVQVFINFPNEERILKPGETVAVTLRNKVGVPKVAVPATAIMQDIKGAYVWTVDKQNVVHRQYIVRGKLDAGVQMVDSGLEPGMKVVTDGTHKVTDGDTISPKVKER